MQSMRKYDLKPRITVAEEDHRQLLALTLGGGQLSDAADDLLEEIERARVVPENKLPPEIVRMGSTVTYRPDNGEERTVTLVYPAEADISANRISVLTPIGTALIGLAKGQSITWTARNGLKHVLSVTAVEDPA
ncbi:nucleoside diphosphate kinase regulator [Devosia sp.]|uniref:nucleoside diphosphate kinase regulator n=1 Tax=Devosia sp. TaxID=1871048 RepID=UPI002EDF8D76